LTLLDLSPGKSGTITKIGGNGRIRHRMLDMGIYIGKKITMVKTAPFKDPVEFAMNGNHISLRRTEAQLIHISSDDND
jgi:Fe2+ transport system protein FeoA